MEKLIKFLDDLNVFFLSFIKLIFLEIRFFLGCINKLENFLNLKMFKLLKEFIIS